MNAPPDIDILRGVLFLVGLAASLWGAAHALLTKRDPRSAAAWVSLCLFFPFVGSLLYVALGNNRVRTRAHKLFAAAPAEEREAAADAAHVADASLIDAEYRNLAWLGHAASGNPLLTHNAVNALWNGEEAYPAMLAAIRSARTRVWLSSYILDGGGIGAEFIAALAQAHARGVQVRVLIDGFGQLYSWPRAAPRLRVAGIPVALYLAPRLIPPNFFVNLRNHRKILVVDGDCAFTGGMNIRDRHLARGGDRPGIVDVHFELRGPVVRQLAAVFAADWAFCTREALALPATPGMAGESECRVIVDGPNEDLDKLLWVMLGAIAAARRSITLVTPYFLPPRELAVALQTAAMRGVSVHVLLPRNNNFPFMNWAATHTLGHLIASGIHVHFVDGPFVHAKLFVVDDYYAQIGSSNLDPRSLRLNFELAVEVYDRAVAAGLGQQVALLLARSRRMTHAEWQGRSLPRRLRDAFFWLFSPYL